MPRPGLRRAAVRRPRSAWPRRRSHGGPAMPSATIPMPVASSISGPAARSAPASPLAGRMRGTPRPGAAGRTARPATPRGARPLWPPGAGDARCCRERGMLCAGPDDAAVSGEPDPIATASAGERPPRHGQHRAGGRDANDPGHCARRGWRADRLLAPPGASRRGLDAARRHLARQGAHPGQRRAACLSQAPTQASCPWRFIGSTQECDTPVECRQQLHGRPRPAPSDAVTEVGTR